MRSVSLRPISSALAVGAALSLLASGLAPARAPRAETAANQFVPAEGTRFAYRSFGAGSPVVLLHRFRATMDHWDPALFQYRETFTRLLADFLAEASEAR